MGDSYTKSVDVLFGLLTVTLGVLYFYFADLLGGGRQFYQPIDIAIAGMWVFIITTLFLTFTKSIFEDSTNESVSSLLVSGLTGQVLWTLLRTVLVTGFAYITGITETMQEVQLLAILVFGISFLITVDGELETLRNSTSTLKNVYKPIVRQYVIGNDTIARDTDGDLIDGATGEEVDTSEYSLGRFSAIFAVLAKGLGKGGLFVGLLATIVLFVLSIMTVLSVGIPNNVFMAVIGVVVGSVSVGVVGLIVLYIILFNSSSAISVRAMIGTVLFMGVETIISIRYHIGVLLGLWYATPLSQSAIATVFVFWVFTVVSVFAPVESTE